MNCKQCDDHLGEFIDDELTAAQTTEVQQHLQDCESCRNTLEELRVVDTQLRRLRVPENGIADVLMAAASEKQTPPNRFFPWSIVAMVAASIAFAFVLIPQTEAPAPIAGRLVRATGWVEVLTPGTDQWQRVEAEKPVSMQNGARVRTSPSVSCEIETTEKAKLRLDAAAELILHTPSRVEVVKGQVWCRASDTKPIRVDTNSPDTGKPRPFSMTCASASEFQWTVDEEQSVCHSLSGRETQWEIPQFQCPVSPGERVSVDTEHNVHRSMQDSPSTKIWQLPLLAIGQTGRAELEEIIESVLVRIGSTKAGYLHENQIRQLGAAGAIPLLAYVQSDSSREKVSIRHHAMRIATDLADQSAATRLKQLRDDEDPAIAELANSYFAPPK